MANAPQVCPLVAPSDPSVAGLGGDPGTIAKTEDGYFYEKYGTGSTDWLPPSYTDEEYYKSRACGLLSCSRLSSWAWDDFVENSPANVFCVGTNATYGSISSACGVVEQRLKAGIGGNCSLAFGKSEQDYYLLPSGTEGSWYAATRFKSDSIATGSALYIQLRQVSPNTSVTCGNLTANMAGFGAPSATTAEYSFYGTIGADAAWFPTGIALDTNMHIHEVWRQNGMTYYAIDGVIKIMKNVWHAQCVGVKVVSVTLAANQTATTGSIDWICFGIPSGQRMP
jgi:hypothetical protein